MISAGRTYGLTGLRYITKGDPRLTQKDGESTEEYLKRIKTIGVTELNKHHNKTLTKYSKELRESGLRLPFLKCPYYAGAKRRISDYGASCSGVKGKLSDLLTENTDPKIKALIDKEILNYKDELTVEEFLSDLQRKYLLDFNKRFKLKPHVRKLLKVPDDESAAARQKRLGLLKEEVKSFLRKHLGTARRKGDRQYYIDETYAFVNGKIYKKVKNIKTNRAKAGTKLDPENQCYDRTNGSVTFYEDCTCGIGEGDVDCEQLREDLFPKSTHKVPSGKIRAKLYFNVETKELRLIPDKKDALVPKGFQPLQVVMRDPKTRITFEALRWLFSRHTDAEMDPKNGGKKILLDFLKLEKSTAIYNGKTNKGGIYRNEDGHYVVDIGETRYLTNYNMHLGKGDPRKVVQFGIRLTPEEAATLVKVINSSPEFKTNEHVTPITIKRFAMENKEEKDGVVTYEYRFPGDMQFLRKLEKFIKSKYVEEEVLGTKEIKRSWYQKLNPWGATHKFVMRKTGKHVSAIPGVKASTLKTLLARTGDWLFRDKAQKKQLKLAEKGAKRQKESIKFGKETAAKQLKYAFYSSLLFVAMIVTSILGPEKVKKIPVWFLKDALGRVIPPLRRLIIHLQRKGVFKSKTSNITAAVKAPGAEPISWEAYPEGFRAGVLADLGRRQSIIITGKKGTGKSIALKALAKQLNQTLRQVNYDAHSATGESKYRGVIENLYVETFEAFTGIDDVMVFDEASQLIGEGKSTGSSGIINRIKNIVACNTNPDKSKNVLAILALTTEELTNLKQADPAFIRRFVIHNIDDYGEMDTFRILTDKAEWYGAPTASSNTTVAIGTSAVQTLGELVLRKYPFMATEPDNGLASQVNDVANDVVARFRKILELKEKMDNGQPISQSEKSLVEAAYGTTEKPTPLAAELARHEITDRFIVFYYEKQANNPPPIMRDKDDNIIEALEASKTVSEDKVVPELLKLDPNASELMVEFATRMDATRFGRDPKLVAEMARRLTKIAPPDLLEVEINKFIVDNIDRVTPLTQEQLKAAGFGTRESHLVRQIAVQLNPADVGGNHKALLELARYYAKLGDSELIRVGIASQLGLPHPFSLEYYVTEHMDFRNFRDHDIARVAKRAAQLIRAELGEAEITIENIGRANKMVRGAIAKAASEIPGHRGIEDISFSKASLARRGIEPGSISYRLIMNHMGAETLEIIDKEQFFRIVKKASELVVAETGDNPGREDIDKVAKDAIAKATREVRGDKGPKGGGTPPTGGAATGSGAAGNGRARRPIPPAPPPPKSEMASQGIKRSQTKAITTLPGGWRIDPTAGAVIALQRGEGARGPQAVSYHHMSPDTVGRMVKGQLKSFDRSSHLMIGGRLNPYALEGLRESLRQTVRSTYESFMRPIRGLRDALKEDRVCREREHGRSIHHALPVPAR